MKKIIFLLMAIFLAFNGYSAFLKDVPFDMKQPDGTIIHCFITGDEFHRRVHDKDNYTIIQDPATGYYVYAENRGQSLIPTPFIVGKSDPKNTTLRPFADIPNEQIDQARKGGLKSATIISNYPTKGNVNNIIISIRFEDQEPTSLTVNDYNEKFNSESKQSLKSYFKEVSNSQLNISSYFFPSTHDQTIIEYQDSYPRDYYAMYNANFNSLGYESASIGYQRLQTLFINAIKFVEGQIVNSGINFDSNNDGFIDNIVFLLQGNVDCWGSIMWPATGQISYQSTFIGNKEAYFFNKQFSLKFDPSVFCHEFFHSIGAPDLYHYRQTFENEPTGEWDIMGINKTQHMTTFMKWKYGKWFSAIPEITKPGTYTLKPVSQSPYSCYKIPSPYSSTEYFMVEYRKKEGLFESTLPQNYDDGLIIYRINTQVDWGNSGGPPDEVYVYRPGGSQIFNGDLANASFSASSNRVHFSDDTNPSCLLSNGEPGWIDIFNISSSGNEISFTLNSINFLPKPLNFQANGQKEQVLLSWNSPIKKGNQLQGYNLFINGSKKPINTALITDTSYINPVSGNQIINKFKLTAKYQSGESDSVSCTSYYSTDPTVMDSLALVAIYNQCNGTNWVHNENWLKGPLSTWHGVIYDGRRVQSLQLNGEASNYSGLLNSLPKEIGYLTELNSLDLCYNLLTGSLPKEFFTLNKLNFLRLFFSQLSGEIPKEIGKLKALTTLFLEYCNFSGNIPEEITNLPSLEYLSLSGNSLSGELPKSLWQLSNLNTLVLNENNFSGTIPKEISNLSKLGNLSLFSNNFSGNLPTELGLLKDLVDLNLSYNQFSGPLPNELFNLTKLRHLFLKGNAFSGTIPVTVGNLVNLEWLELNDNNLSGVLPEEIGKLTKMKDLFRLNSNSFTGVIPKGIANFLNVKAIVLGNNKFESIPDLSHFTRLEAIQLDGNKFTFEDFEPNMGIIFPKGSYGITYRSQAKIGSKDTVFCPISKPYALSVYCGGKSNSYQWFKDGVAVCEKRISPEYTITSIAPGDNGTFFCKVTNAVVPNLTILSYPFTIIGENKLIANAGPDIGTKKAL